MANLTPLLLDAHLRRTRGQSPLDESWAVDEVLRWQVEELTRVGDSVFQTGPAWPMALVEERQLDLTPQHLFDVAENLHGERWVGVPWVSPEDAQRLFDLSTVAFEETEGLPDGFMFWPVADLLVLLPSDSDSERASFDLFSLEQWDDNSVRVGTQPLQVRPTRSRRPAGPSLGRVRQCHLHIHRRRPDVPHEGMCLEDENDPCDRGCYEVVKTIGGRPIAVDCGCPG